MTFHPPPDRTIYLPWREFFKGLGLFVFIAIVACLAPTYKASIFQHPVFFPAGKAALIWSFIPSHILASISSVHASPTAGVLLFGLLVLLVFVGWVLYIMIIVLLAILPARSGLWAAFLLLLMTILASDFCGWYWPPFQNNTYG